MRTPPFADKGFKLKNCEINKSNEIDSGVKLSLDIASF
jgi:hypothetical protein